MIYYNYQTGTQSPDLKAIQKRVIPMFETFRKPKQTESTEASVLRLKTALREADAVILGAGAGLSTAAGYTYGGERFAHYFRDFVEKYQIPDMYSGGFYPFASLEEYWAWWSRHIWINRYAPIPSELYSDLLDIVRDKDYFVLTTNVDHCFQRAGFDKERMFYTQGDYGLWQCSRPCHAETYDNEEPVRQMLPAQGFRIEENGELTVPDWKKIQMTVPTELVPRCPRCGRPMTMNLRADDTFVEDAGWHEASERYRAFLRCHEGGKLVFWEIGVGYNTPVIIKYPFWRMTAKNPNAVYVCMSRSRADCPEEIRERSICISGDAREILRAARDA